MPVQISGARKHAEHSTALVQQGVIDDTQLTAEQAVQLAVKTLQEASAIVPAVKFDNDSDDDEEDAPTTAPAFIKKLKQLVDDPAIDSAVWSPDGLTFVIHEPTRLSEQLVKYFKSSKLKSFVRQLHFYGFKKVGGSRSEDWEYNHKYFQRDGRVLHKLRRKTCGPDQQIKNLQMKVDSLHGSLVTTQQKLGDMAVALMAVLQHHNAATPCCNSGANASAPAKRARGHNSNATAAAAAAAAAAAPTAITRFEQRPMKQEPQRQEARRLPASLSFNAIFNRGGGGGGGGAAGFPFAAGDFDFGAEFDDLFSPGAAEEFGLLTDVETRVNAAAADVVGGAHAMAIGVTA